MSHCGREVIVVARPQRGVHRELGSRQAGTEPGRRRLAVPNATAAAWRSPVVLKIAPTPEPHQTRR
jgi:hypothetical protein